MASCGGLATRLFVACTCASVGPAEGQGRPSATRPQDAILPHKRPSSLGYKYAQTPAVLRLNRAGLHFHVAHPMSHVEAAAFDDRQPTEGLSRVKHGPPRAASRHPNRLP